MPSVFFAFVLLFLFAVIMIIHFQLLVLPSVVLLLSSTTSVHLCGFGFHFSTAGVVCPRSSHTDEQCCFGMPLLYLPSCPFPLVLSLGSIMDASSVVFFRQTTSFLFVAAFLVSWRTCFSSVFVGHSTQVVMLSSYYCCVMISRCRPLASH